MHGILVLEYSFCQMTMLIYLFALCNIYGGKKKPDLYQVSSCVLLGENYSDNKGICFLLID